MEQTRFEAIRAPRQFYAVDPGNRLVAAELERRWNDRLAEVARREVEIEALQSQADSSLTPRQREELMALGKDLPRVRSHPVETHIELAIQWRGGDHTELSVVKNRNGQHRRATDVEVKALITQLAHQLNDAYMAPLLNRLGHRLATGTPGLRCGYTRSEATTTLRSIEATSAKRTVN